MDRDAISGGAIVPIGIDKPKIIAHPFWAIYVFSCL
jgi:hypothetical protein